MYFIWEHYIEHANASQVQITRNKKRAQLYCARLINHGNQFSVSVIPAQGRNDEGAHFTKS